MLGTRPHPSISRCHSFVAPASAVLAIVAILLCSPLLAFSSDENDLRDPEEEGGTYFDLPMDVRAHIDATYSDEFYVSDELARPYVSDVGPRIRNDHSLESTVALMRLISDRIEIGIVWGARRPLMNLDLLDFERQTVGAMIRLTR